MTSAVSTGPVVVIDTDRITDAQSFHEVFSQACGFPGFYGRNMDAWIDCMSSLDTPEDALTTVHVAPGSVVTLVLTHAVQFKKRCPALYDAVIECAAGVNRRQLEWGRSAVLALAF